MNGDTEGIKTVVAREAEDFAHWLFPSGRKIGLRWHIGDLSGAPGRSLEISLQGRFAGCFHDWSTGERGDCIAIVMAVRGLDFASAKRVLRERYRLPIDRPRLGPKVDRKAKASQRTEPLETKRLKLPPLAPGSREDFRRLSEARNLTIDALELASQRGNLWFFNSQEGRAWLISDATRRNTQARRLDGKPWTWNSAKAWTLGGSCASWPIGLPESELFPSIALCEGGPDFLAAFHHALASNLERHVAPLCIVGATMRIAVECLPSFAGKRVRIFVHNDKEGLAAAKRWKRQLYGIALQVDGFRFDGLNRTDGKPVKDLCDLASVDYESWEAERDAIENCMAFATELESNHGRRI